MMVMTPREKWTDEQLDGAFARVDGELRELRGDVKDLRREMNEGFKALHRLLFNSAVIIIAALIGLFVTLIGVNAF